MLTLLSCLCSCYCIHLKHILSCLYWNNSSCKAHLKFYILWVLPDAPKLNVISSLNLMESHLCPSYHYHIVIAVITLLYLFLCTPYPSSIHGVAGLGFIIHVSSNSLPYIGPHITDIDKNQLSNVSWLLRIMNAMWSTFWIMVFLLYTKEIGKHEKKSGPSTLSILFMKKGKWGEGHIDSEQCSIQRWAAGQHRHLKLQLWSHAASVWLPGIA